ncbi:mitochondrial K+-H+ exchange-related family protein [Aspergillus homomorphus CBS 101889]|uniref:Mitochondrial K+-H+ exchange-related-domain-containing protein n=1 Tax=Aspergillus homomorphus (strain CBS 101889) TaxID=1450537 RepID=A0A395HH87_ASPHC|nr:hypothetical protein BO97DRAFT_473852 [Aspergillus homomorphus CBS 101889]RAL07187.1 hypothetical protein BO97DRAFT_473852 [Aspergillus homomorphus CBS 101889]
MRLFIVPISTRRALIYARPVGQEISKERSYIDKITNKAAETWAKWEEAEKGWKKHLVNWGNRVQQRIPYQEWGLKSIPSLASQRRSDKSYGTKKVDVLFPGNAIRSEKLHSLLYALATERQDLHRKRMYWSMLATPLTIPVGLLPVIPNIPFFYLVYRSWSHRRALMGSKHLQYLLEKNLLNPISYPALEKLYAKRVSHALEKTGADTPLIEMVKDVEESDDKLLLRMSDAKKLATILDAPDLALEAERAIVQVQEQLSAHEEEDQKQRPPKEKQT